MRQVLCYFSLGMVVLLAAVSLWASDVTAPPPTVEARYLGLSGGPLRLAALVTLPEGIVLRAGATTITANQVADEVAKANPQVQAQLKKHRVFLVEQLAIKAMLLTEARAWAAAEKRNADESDDAVIRAYAQHLAQQATVTDEELKAFYAANKEMLGGIPYATVEKELRGYLLEQKQQQAIEDHLRTLGVRFNIEIDAAWTDTHAATSLDNPVDRARRTGKPAMVDFGASGCGPCDMMAPILKELGQTYAAQCAILYIDVREEQLLAARYGVQGIPEQIFFDKDGKEVFRHTGYFSRDEILAKLAELGVK